MCHLRILSTGRLPQDVQELKLTCLLDLILSKVLYYWQLAGTWVVRSVGTATYLVLRVPPLLAGSGGSHSGSTAEDALMIPCFWPANRQLLNIKDRLFIPAVRPQRLVSSDKAHRALKWEGV